MAALCLTATVLAGCNAPQVVHWTPSLASPERGRVFKSLALPTGVLYESDRYHSAVEIFKNGSWNKVGQISNGISNPDGTWLDKHGFYVANIDAANITEYTSSSSPAFTYNKGMKDPVAVTTDRSGNVYEADYDNDGYAGFVNEYSQASNVVTAHCVLKGSVQDVAIDPKGNVFADYSTHYYGGKIAEFTAFPGCTAHTLGVRFRLPAGIAIDAHGNLLVCDLYGPAVYVVAPPYKRITRRFGSRFSGPFRIAINAQNTRAFVADYVAGTVDIFEYPSGKRLATLKKGIGEPLGVVDSSNYAP